MDVYLDPCVMGGRMCSILPCCWQAACDAWHRVIYAHDVVNVRCMLDMPVEMKIKMH